MFSVLEIRIGFASLFALVGLHIHPNLPSILSDLAYPQPAPPSPPPPRIDLFVNGGHYAITYPCYRQPALINADASGSHLIAFAEGRNISMADCAPPLQASRRRAQPSPANEVGGLVQRLSQDGGRTWSPPQTIYSGDIDFYTTVRDDATGTVWLMLQEGSAVQVRVQRNHA